MTDKTPYPDDLPAVPDEQDIDPAVLALTEAVIAHQQSLAARGGMLFGKDDQASGRVRAWQKAITVRLNASEGRRNV